MKRNKILYLQILVPILIVLIGLSIIIYKRNESKKPVVQSQTIINEKKNLDQNFDFKLNKNLTFKYILVDTELKSEIIIKGVRAKATNGKKFLIVNLKIINNEKNAFQLRTRDYIRLLSNKDNGEWIASDIHNDPLEVQALSTKYSRLGFTVDQNQKQFKILVGEINGEKKEISIDF